MSFAHVVKMLNRMGIAVAISSADKKRLQRKGVSDSHINKPKLVVSWEVMIVWKS